MRSQSFMLFISTVRYITRYNEIKHIIHVVQRHMWKGHVTRGVMSQAAISCHTTMCAPTSNPLREITWCNAIKHRIHVVKMIGSFAKETYHFEEPTNSHVKTHDPRRAASHVTIRQIPCRKLLRKMIGSFAKETYHFEEPTNSHVKTHDPRRAASHVTIRQIPCCKLLRKMIGSFAKETYRFSHMLQSDKSQVAVSCHME